MEDQEDVYGYDSQAYAGTSSSSASAQNIENEQAENSGDADNVGDADEEETENDASKKQRRSGIWAHFSEVVNDLGERYAKCNYCET